MKTEIKVVLEGLSDIMFDRFFDHSKEDRPPEKKMLLSETQELFFSDEALFSFLFRDMAPVGVIRKVEKRNAKDFIDMGQSHIGFRPHMIPFINDHKQPVVFNGFKDAMDKTSRFYVNNWSAGITKLSGGKVIKQEVRPRPVLRVPWGLSFSIDLFENDKVTPDKLKSWFETGGLLVALGTYRPRHGRFAVAEWNVI